MKSTEPSAIIGVISATNDPWILRLAIRVSPLFSHFTISLIQLADKLSANLVPPLPQVKGDVEACMEAGIALLLVLRKNKASLPLTSQLLLATLSLKFTVVSKLIPPGNSFGLPKENSEVKKEAVA